MSRLLSRKVLLFWGRSGKVVFTGTIVKIDIFSHSFIYQNTNQNSPMSERYYWPCDKTGGTVPQTAELSGDESHHLTRVMRRKCGDLVTLFDGHGREYRAEITDTQKDRVALRILETRTVDAEPQRQVTIAALHRYCPFCEPTFE